MTTGLPIDDLVTTIKRAIKEADISDTDTDRDLRVTSVYLKLQTVATTKTGGGIDFRIPFIGMKLKFSGTVTHRDTHALELTLVPEDLAASGHEIRDGAVETALVDAIETLRRLITAAGTGDDPFVLKDSTVELQFALEEDGTVSLGLEGGLKNEVTHILRLTLGSPATP